MVKLKNVLGITIDVEEEKHYHHFVINIFYNILIDFDGNYLSKDTIVEIIFNSVDALVTIDVNETGLVLEKFCVIILWTERFYEFEKAINVNKWFRENMETFHNAFGARCTANGKCGPALDFLVKIKTDTKYLVSVGTMCYDNGNRDNAKKYYLKAVKLEANNPSVRKSIENIIHQKYANDETYSIWNIIYSINKFIMGWVD